MWIVARIDVCRRRARSRAGEMRAAWDMVWGRGLSCKNLNPCGPARVRQAERAQVGEAAAFELPAATRVASKSVGRAARSRSIWVVTYNRRSAKHHILSWGLVKVPRGAKTTSATRVAVCAARADVIR